MMIEERFARLALEAEDIFQVPLEHILRVRQYKTKTVVKAREWLVSNMMDVSHPELGSLFMCDQSTFSLLKRRIYARRAEARMQGYMLAPTAE